MEELRKCYAELSARLRSIENDHETDILEMVLNLELFQSKKNMQDVLAFAVELVITHFIFSVQKMMI